jgi:hypothetical protein
MPKEPTKTIAKSNDTIFTAGRGSDTSVMFSIVDTYSRKF